MILMSEADVVATVGKFELSASIHFCISPVVSFFTLMRTGVNMKERLRDSFLLVKIVLTHVGVHRAWINWECNYGGIALLNADNRMVSRKSYTYQANHFRNASFL